MTAQHDKPLLYHSPNTRSSVSRLLLEELGVPYEIHALDMKAGAQRKADYLAVNPMGKVPALSHNGGLVTETTAIFIYLADAFPAAGLAPAIGDPLRGPYLRWIAYYAAAFEPAVIDKALKREPAPPSMAPYGDFDTMLSTLTGQLAKGTYILGDRFTAADVLWGAGLTWTVGFKLVPELPEITAYLARHAARPAVPRVKALDDALAAKLAG